MPRAGRFELDEVIARGATATVLRGHDPVDGQPVAIKLLEQGRITSQAARERFTTELRVLGRLHHPNLVAVRGSGEEAGVPFIAMDLVVGTDLSQRLARGGPLPAREAVEGVRDLALALHYAHSCGVFHRDVKPSNVLIDGTGRFLLTDFGLALDVADERERLTRTGTMLGTPGFWAPEQALGQLGAIDARTDVWGLGATLFAALTGSAPLPSDSLSAWLDAHKREEPCRFPPGSNVPAALQAVILGCLERDPERRPASADELARGLTLWLRGSASSSGPARRAPLVALAVTLVLGGLVAAALPRSRPASSTPGPKQVDSHADAPPDPAWLVAEATRLRAAGEPRPALAALDRALAQDPDRVPALELRGTLRREVDDREAAAADFEHLCRLQPESARAHALRAWCLGGPKRAAAEEALARARTLDPDCAEAWMAEAELRHAFEAAALQASRDAAERALAKDPGLAPAWLLRGMARFYLGDEAAGLADLDRALELAPCARGTWHIRGFFHWRRQDPRAEADLTRAIELTGAQPDDQFYRGWARSRLGWIDLALADLAAVPARQDIPRAWAVLAETRLVRGDAARALDDAERALSNLERQGGEEFVVPIARRTRALARFELRLEGEADPQVDLSEARRWLGESRNQAGDQAGGLALIEALLRDEPDNLQARTARMFILAELGRIPEASEEAERLVVAGETLGLVARCWMRMVRADDAGAVADGAEASARSPDTPFLQGFYGLALALAGRDDEALQECDPAVASAPSIPRVPEGFLGRALVRFRRGDLAGGRADLADAAARLGPRADAHPLVRRVRGLIEGR